MPNNFMKFVDLSNSDFKCIVDDEDFDRVSKFTWYLNASKSSVICYKMTLAPFIMRRMGVMFDHIDRNPLNNCKSNLREATQSQNMMNTTKRKGCSSKYKGVSWNKKMKTWIAQIQKAGNHMHLGSFKDENSAAEAYNNAAIKHFGEFAVLNEIR